MTKDLLQVNTMNIPFQKLSKGAHTQAIPFKLQWPLKIYI